MQRPAYHLEGLVDGTLCKEGVNFVVGDAGSGKSTLLMHLARRLAEGEGDDSEVPILVTPADLPPDVNVLESDRLSLIKKALEPDEPQLWRILESMLKDTHRQLHVTLLLDGLDEVPSHCRLFELVSQFHKHFKCRRTIIASRPEAFEVATRSAKRYPVTSVVRVRPLNPERCIEMAGDLLRLESGPSEKEVQRLMGTITNIIRESKIDSPLLIFLICLKARGEQQVDALASNNQAELYQGVVEYLLRRGVHKLPKEKQEAYREESRERFSNSVLSWPTSYIG